MLDFSVTFIITIINITILFLILRVILFKPVTKFMAARAKGVQDSIDSAEKDKALARETLSQYEKKLENVEAEARTILESARKDAESQSKRIIADGKREAGELIASAHKQIDAEYRAAMTKFRLDAASLVVTASEKLISMDFTDEDNLRYVNNLLEELAGRVSAAKKGNS